MNPVKAIRERLGLTQRALAEGLGCTQGNVANYEAGQTMLPGTAKVLIALALARGLRLSYDHIYGDAKLPEPSVADKAAADA
ncbi:helix-turn-helix domain-containing protein [Variovorax atrisoli]|uniref:helix-turn-helix domain-containing protein n=1 Tax=Variovorax atrisoli TaxID=3394203 RepID=UPI000360B184|nr:helix-turn-helix transcriptional regulator [Variovorax paradoxus]